MMEFKLIIDITDKLADAISALSASIADAQKCHAASVTENVAQIVGKVSTASLSSHKKAPQCAQEAPECAKEPEPVIIQTEPESAKIDLPESQEPAPAIDEERAADCAGVQFHCPTPAQPLPAVSTDADTAPAQQEKPEPEKPKKKKSVKKAAETPAPAEAPQPESKPEPLAVEAPAYPEPAKTDAPKAAKTDAPKAADGDPMGGMTVMEAVQALFDAIQQKGLEIADVNARVRAKANDLGLSYSSIACLIKAVGYVEARRIALGE